MLQLRHALMMLLLCIQLYKYLVKIYNQNGIYIFGQRAVTQAWIIRETHPK